MMSPEYTDLPVACTLTDQDLAAHRQHLLAALFPYVEAQEPLDDGYAWRFGGSDERWADLVAFVQFERRCCSFLRLQLIAEPQQGPLWLKATGPPGTKAFLAALFTVSEQRS